MKKVVTFFLLMLLGHSTSNAQSNAVLDPGFGNNGVVQTEATNSAELTSITLQPNDKIIASGMAWHFDSLSNIMYSHVARYNPDGSLDAGFGNQGLVNLPLNIKNGADNTVVQPDGKILVSGFTITEQGGGMEVTIGGHGFLFRLNENGPVDSSFGNNGLVLFSNLTGGQQEASDAFSCRLLPDGKIIAMTNVSNANTQLLPILMRLNQDGAIDSSFGNNGKVLIPFEAEMGTWLTIVQVDSDGILAAGTTGDLSSVTFPPDMKVALIKFKLNGTIDSSFGINGRVITVFDSTRNNDLFVAASVQQDGKILLAANSSTHLAMARYTVDGNLDNTFGTGGKIVYTHIQAPVAMQLLANGKIALADNKTIESPGGSTEFDFRLSLYNADGSRLMSFGDTGSVVVDVSKTDYTHCLFIQPDKKILIGGSTVDTSGKALFTLLRLQTDTTTGISGKGHPNALNLQVYPNPTEGKLYLSYDNIVINNMQLLDFSGRLLRTFAPGGKELDISDIAQGIYLLNVQTNKGKKQVIKVLRK